MAQKLGMIRKGYLSELISLESSIARPPEDIIQKIQNLSGLLETHIPNWRTADKKPEIYIPKRNGIINGFRSQPTFSTPPTNHNYSKPIHKSSSDGNFPRNGVKYVSKYKNTEKQVEDKILNTIILNKLNKFSESTYNDIRDFLYQVLGTSSESEEFVKDFVQLVFKKATSEEIFCPLYAKLLSESSEKYPIVLEEMNKLHENYMLIFNEEDDTSSNDYQTFLSKNIEKKYRLGYSQFLSELTLLDVLPPEKLVTIFEIIFKQILIQGKIGNKNSLNDEYIECLLRITKVLKDKKEPFFVDIRNNLLLIVNDPIDTIKNNKAEFISISNKSRFLMLNIKDYLQ